MKTKLILIAFLASTVFTACKYEEGPVISVRSKSERIVNHWKAEKVYENGNDITSEYDQYELIFSKDGSSTIIAKYSFAGGSFTFDTKGTWSLIDAKETLVTKYENSDADKNYTILKLKEDEMWLREKGGTVEFHLVTAN